MIAFELGQERYDSQPGESLRNAQLYPSEFVAGYEHAVEMHQDRYTESRWEEGLTW